MTIESLGDAAYIVRDLHYAAHAYVEPLLRAGIPGVLDVSSSYETLGIYTVPGAVLSESLLDVLSGITLTEQRESKVLTIPVCYELGEDLAPVCDRLAVDRETFVSTHSGIDYQCFAVGFSPGFPYLGWVPELLQGVPRRDQPRTKVEPGSVGITGRQTAVYPSATPGGWALVGRTPLVLVDVEDQYFPISAGDKVRFVAIDESEFKRFEGQRL